MNDIPDSEILGCFGQVDRLFAIHPYDEQRAFALLQKLRLLNTAWSDVRDRFRQALYADGCRADHITEQIVSVEAHYRPWLYDNED